LNGDREIDHGGTAQDADRGVELAMAEGCLLGQVGRFAVRAAAKGDPHSGNTAGGVARNSGHHAGGDADGSGVAEVEGVPDLGDKPGDPVDDGRLQGGGHGDVGGGEAANGFPDSAEFLQGGLAVHAVALVFSQLARAPVGSLLE
jgi:hypothetical protein